MTENKLDKIQDDLTDIKVTLAENTLVLRANTDSLVEHVKRTALAEERISTLEDRDNKFTGAWLALVAVGGLILGLHELGILQKLFG